MWEGGRILHRKMPELPQLLQSGDLLVFNDTRVIPASLRAVRRRAGLDQANPGVSINLDRQVSATEWRVLAKPARRLRPEDRLDFGAGLEAEVQARTGDQIVLRFNCAGAEFESRLEAVGAMPLPPYISSRRPVDAQDQYDYQSVLATRAGAVAAPTASLHFDGWLLEQLDKQGIARTTVTLHVGSGTFLPVRTDDLSLHKLHAEWGEISNDTASRINEAKRSNRRVIAIGTTAMRLLEASARDGEVRPWTGETDLFIRPGFRFRVVDGLLTNFHLPKSTLLVLVAAFIGMEGMRRVYRAAVDEKYRFYSYGDGSLLLP